MVRARPMCPSLPNSRPPVNTWRVGRLAVPSLLAAGLLLLLSQPATAKSSAVQPAGRIVEYEVPSPNAEPMGIAIGSEGNIWFTEANADKIGRITPTGQIVEYPLPTPRSEPFGITAGPNQSMWFTERKGDKVGEISQSGVITEFPIEVKNAEPTGIAAGKPGTVWVTAPGIARLFTMDAAGEMSWGGIGEAGSRPEGIAADAAGRVWYTEPALGVVGNGEPGRCVSESGCHTFPLRSRPTGIAFGQNEKTWITEEGANRVAYFVDPEDGVAEFPIPTAASEPADIVEDSSEDMWFTERAGNKISEVATDGLINEYPIPTPNSEPTEITAGPNESLWFSETAADKIGRIDVADTSVQVGLGQARATVKGRLITLQGIKCGGNGSVACKATIRLTMEVRRLRRPWLARAILFARGRYWLFADFPEEAVQMHLTRDGFALLRRLRHVRVNLDMTASESAGAQTTIALRR